MTEVAEIFDSSALELLVQELSGDLPDQVSSLLDNKHLRGEILKYLNDISSIESKSYLSSVPPTPAAGDMNVIEERTLVQDIAELDASLRSIDTDLKNLIVKSQHSIIESKKNLDLATERFNNEFTVNFKSLWRLFDEDGLDEIQEMNDPDLHELEADLEPDNKPSQTFHTELSAIKNLNGSNNDGDEHNKNLSIVLENMDQIVNILELPSLTAACIKAGYYSEALEISSYTRRLAIRFPNILLIKEVETGIKKEMSHMLTGLVRLLRTNLKQSSLIKIVSYLKRIPPFSQVDNADDQLKRILLHARYNFIKSEMGSLIPLKESELYEKYLKRCIEVVREHCFGSIMTYKNIFPDIDNDEDLCDVEIELEEEPDEVVAKEGSKTYENQNNDKNEKDDAKQEKDLKSEETADRNTEGASGDGQENEGDKSEEPEEDNTEEEDEEDNTEEEDEEEEEKKKAGEINEKKEEADKEKDIEDKREKNEKEVVEEKQKAEIESQNIERPKEKSDDKFQFITPSEKRSKSNRLLFDFVKHVLQELVSVIEVSLPKIEEPSVQDGLYLQLIYCLQSLGRIDNNLSDLMTALVLNTKKDGVLLVNRKAWEHSVKKQRQLAKTLSQ